MPRITLELAQEALTRLTKMVRDEKSVPVAGVVVCESGLPVALARMDGAPPRIAAFAMSKAYTAAYREASTLAFRDFLRAEGLELAAFCNPQLTSIPGGVPVHCNGRCVGAVGISGGMPMPDHELACRFAAELESLLLSREES